MAMFGLPSIAEAAALAGAGPSSVLLVARKSAGGASCAIAGKRET
jgi:cobalt-precorrin 5A hydrolase